MNETITHDSLPASEWEDHGTYQLRRIGGQETWRKGLTTVDGRPIKNKS